MRRICFFDMFARHVGDEPLHGDSLVCDHDGLSVMKNSKSGPGSVLYVFAEKVFRIRGCLRFSLNGRLIKVDLIFSMENLHKVY